jgi:hypothetical protein
MAGQNRKSWRELCTAALEARDPDELLLILWEPHKALKREEQIRRDFREAGGGKPPQTAASMPFPHSASGTRDPGRALPQAGRGLRRSSPGPG